MSSDPMPAPQSPDWGSVGGGSDDPTTLQVPNLGTFIGFLSVTPMGDYSPSGDSDSDTAPADDSGARAFGNALQSLGNSALSDIQAGIDFLASGINSAANGINTFLNTGWPGQSGSILDSLPAITPIAALSEFSAAEATTTSVFWSGSEAAPGVAQSAARSWAAANGGTTLSVAVSATPAEIATASGNFAAQASGNVVVFQSAIGVSATGDWALTEFPTLMANPNVTGITYNIVDNSGATVCTIVCPK